MGEVMFKYFPQSRFDVLLNNLICFSNPINFNDPFEFYSIFEFSKMQEFIEGEFNNLDFVSILDNLTEEQRFFYNSLSDDDKLKFLELVKPAAKIQSYFLKDNVDALANQLFKKFNESLIDVVRVLCLSEKPDNLLMWGHYAESHTGFVIEFDETHSFFNQRRSLKDEFGFLRKVKYQKDINVIDPTKEDSAVEHFILKSEEWKYESEWRMLMPVNMASESKVYNNIVYDLFSFPSNSIKCIILGCRSGDEFDSKVKDLINNDDRYSHVKLFKCKRSDARYEVLINPIDV
ncbi:hypothetical protein SerAS12_4087 [Serratia sp. AS12]|uniref:DUF2971 domain-containing protein n=1 Tax=Serratia TaxID=613 RepID=UPI00020E9C24|nr:MULTISPECIES: DUF2971 domain-containing protein [Serratia]AEF47185.1 hypothetical protein SerAS9_4086 [Serratia plymuthica AS9]AEF52137.1 hypothetical protein SerAS12_4087 [Serratia sp. AS12]AEG29844.1 hypothetical protein SerAS13_4087 [Serratia sp. AS13]UTN95870.1 DUF2971 domain-containing protein [Serratia plymuthica]